MKAVRFLLIMLTLFNPATWQLRAQDSAKVTVNFAPMYGDKPLIQGQTYDYHDSGITISTLRFYVSGIALYHKGKPVYKEAASYHLIDIEDTASLRLTVSMPAKTEYDTIRFYLGIDSSTNVAGVMGGDLDPTKGMYWSWQSGYINFKMEGTSPLCPARKHEFQFHIGGYAAPFASLQTVVLPVHKGRGIVIAADVAELLSVIDVSVQHSMMIPGADAVALAQKAAMMFSVRP